MRQLSHELRHVQDILEDLKAICEVNVQMIIFDIIAHLPNFVEDRWHKEELKNKHSKGKYLKFTDLVNFFKLVVDEIFDPLCGVEAVSDRSIAHEASCI